MDVLQRTQLSVPGAKRGWTDSGMVFNAGQTLRLSAGGAILSDSSRHRYAFPEGTYPDATSPVHARDPQNMVPVNGSSRLPASNVRPSSLALALRSGTDPPNDGIDSDDAISDGLQGDRALEFQVTTAGRLWLIFNDINTKDNAGAFDVTIERLGTLDPLLPGSVSPIRFFPPDIAREKRSSVESTAVCWFIRPKTGPPEGYTEMDFPVVCPQIPIESGAGDDGTPLYTTLPPLSYQPFSGLGISSVPTSIKLGVDAPDVTLVNFDHTKLRREYYEEAQVEVFEIPLDGDRSKPLLYLSGVLGNCQGDDLSATIELTPWDELTNLPVGWKMGFMCDIGRPPGERFGTKRCLNEKRRNGVDIANWTRGARLTGFTSTSRLTLTPQTVAGFSGFEPTFPGALGILRFSGGVLDGLMRDIGKFDASTGVVTLRRALPVLPPIDAWMVFEAGCDRSFDGPQGCIFWQQGRNFRGTPHLPGRKALTRIST